MRLSDESRTAPPRDRDMLCFSHDWNGDPLSKTHLMRLLARENRVLWVNSIGYRAPSACRRDAGRAIRKLLAAAEPVREVEPNIFVLSPLVVPAYGSPSVKAFNRWVLRLQVMRAMRSLGMERPISWVFNPAAAIVAGTLGEDLLIYYCVDEYAAFSGVASETMRAREKELLEKSDLVIASSEPLLTSKRAARPDAVLVRHGVDWAHFRTALDERTAVPVELASLPRPVMGYFGLLATDWVDVGLLEHVARSMPSVSLVLIGRQTMDLSVLRRYPNVHLLGHRPYAALPAYCKGFDAGIIPFPISEVTRNSNPLKAREYLGAGLAVVSTDIPEVRTLKFCRIAEGPDRFVEQARAALAETGNREVRSESVRGESWESRLEEISGHIARAAGAKESRRRLAA